MTTPWNGPGARSLGDWENVVSTPGYSMLRRKQRYVLAPTNRRNGAAAIATDEEGNVLLLEVYREALDEIVLEIPRGFADDGEDPKDCALREFEEETGISTEGTKVRYLGEAYPDSGILASRVQLFHIVFGRPMPKAVVDPAEALGARKVSVTSAMEMMAKGKISDTITMAALSRLAEDVTHIFGAPKGIEKQIFVFDADKKLQTSIMSSSPDWAFEQYCRNRETVGWTWAFSQVQQ